VGVEERSTNLVSEIFKMSGVKRLLESKTWTTVIPYVNGEIQHVQKNRW